MFTGEDAENCNEQNGNVIKNDNNRYNFWYIISGWLNVMQNHSWTNEIHFFFTQNLSDSEWDLCDEKRVFRDFNVFFTRISDDDEESNSLENDPLPSFGNLQVDDKNANCGAQGKNIIFFIATIFHINCFVGGAVGRIHSPNAYAEIEGEESELVTIDTPMFPQRDLIALLKQTQAVPVESSKIICIKSFFINVDEERISPSQSTHSINEHVRELMQEYQGRDESKYSLIVVNHCTRTSLLKINITEVKTTPTSPGNISQGDAGAVADGEEKYEKGVPMHGDVMFHNFLTTVLDHPGQLLR